MSICESSLHTHSDFSDGRFPKGSIRTSLTPGSLSAVLEGLGQIMEALSILRESQQRSEAALSALVKGDAAHKHQFFDMNRHQLETRHFNSHTTVTSSNSHALRTHSNITEDGWQRARRIPTHIQSEPSGSSPSLRSHASRTHAKGAEDREGSPQQVRGNYAPKNAADEINDVAAEFRLDESCGEDVRSDRIHPSRAAFDEEGLQQQKFVDLSFASVSSCEEAEIHGGSSGHVAFASGGADVGIIASAIPIRSCVSSQEKGCSAASSWKSSTPDGQEDLPRPVVKMTESVSSPRAGTRVKSSGGLGTRGKSSVRSVTSVASSSIVDSFADLPQHTVKLTESAANQKFGPGVTEMQLSSGSDAVWPKSIELRPEHNKLQHNRSFVTHTPVTAAKAISRMASMIQTASSMQMQPADERFAFMLPPTSRRRLLLDALGAFVLSFEMLAVPVNLAWDLKPRGPHLANVMIPLFWILDIGFSLRTGYYSSGELKMRPSDVALHYLKTWFCIDFCALLMQVASILAVEVIADGDHPHRSRTLTLGKVLRGLSLLRIIRMRQFFQRFSDFSMHEWGHVVGQAALLVATIFIVNHMIACMWFAVGQHAPSDTGSHWPDTIAETSRSYKSENRRFQYTTSLHWSLCQMTPGSMTVQPVNTRERIFNVGCLIFGMLFFSQTVSFMSTKMMQSRMKVLERDARLADLRVFLHQNKISSRLCVVIHKHVMERMKLSSQVALKDVPAIQQLSMRLRAELQKELCANHVVQHPLFQIAMATDSVLFGQATHDAMEYITLSPGDNLFLPGFLANSSYFFVRGELLYIQEPSTSRVMRMDERVVDEGSWICEAALFTMWYHVGVIEASSDCGLVQVGPRRLLEIWLLNRTLGEVVSEYARRYWVCVTSVCHPGPWPDDLEVPGTGFDELMVTMPPKCRMDISSIALLTFNRFLDHKISNSLKAEVESGKSLLIPGGNGVERVVILATIRMQRDDGKLFVQIGTADGAKKSATLVFRPQCMLLGTKVRAHELPKDALQRMLESELKPLATCLKAGSTEVQVHIKDSETVNLKTKYIRVVYHAELDEMAEPPDVETPICFGKKSQGGAFVLREDTGEALLCAWVSPTELSHLTADVGKKTLEDLVSHFAVHQDAIGELEPFFGGREERSLTLDWAPGASAGWVPGSSNGSFRSWL